MFTKAVWITGWWKKNENIETDWKNEMKIEKDWKNVLKDLVGK